MDIDFSRDTPTLPGFNMEDPALARAPARRFSVSDGADRTFFSHGLFAVLAMGFGSYFGSLRELVNPQPAANPQPEGARTNDVAEERAIVASEAHVTELSDLSSFWQSFFDRYEDIYQQTIRPRAHHSVLRTEAGGFHLSYPSSALLAARPVEYTDSGFRFRFPAFHDHLKHGHLVPAKPEVPASHSGIGRTPDDQEPRKSSTEGTPPGRTPNQEPKLNRSPVSRGPVSLGTSYAGLSMLLAFTDLAQAATDPDGDPLSISQLHTLSGSIRRYDDAHWIFTPEQGKIGLVTFSYNLSDGQASILGEAYLRLSELPPKELAGTEADNILVGTAGKDVIDAGGGNDTVLARDGDDMIYGRDGDDVLFGGAGNDVLDGGAGDDRMFGGDGDDLLFGGAGNDRLWGDAGNDRLVGGDGNDVLLGGAGDDRVFGDEGADLISGEDGDDLLSGGMGDDTLSGGGGDDLIFGDEGNDTFLAGQGPVLEAAVAVSSREALHPVSIDDSGSDLAASDGNDMIDGGEGTDCYDASMIGSSVIINLDEGYAEGTAIGHDELRSIENAIGGSGADTIVASSAVNVLIGGAGDDVFVFRSIEALSNDDRGHDEIRDFQIGDKIDFSELSKELGKLYFSDDDRLDGSEGLGDHWAMIRFYHDLSSADEDRQVVQILTDIDGDDECELVVFSHHGLSNDDFILKAIEPVDHPDLFMA